MQSSGSSVSQRFPFPDLLSLYGPLGDDEIRVLVLAPSQNHRAPLEGHCETLYISRTPANQQRASITGNGYVALSDARVPRRYKDVWGSLTLKNHPLPISSHLQHALLDLRGAVQELRIWIATICMDSSIPVDSARWQSSMRDGYAFASVLIIFEGIDTSHDSPQKLHEDTTGVSAATAPLDSYGVSSEWDSNICMLPKSWFANIRTEQSWSPADLSRLNTVHNRSGRSTPQYYAGLVKLLRNVEPVKVVDTSSIQEHNQVASLKQVSLGTVPSQYNRDEELEILSSRTLLLESNLLASIQTESDDPAALWGKTEAMKTLATCFQHVGISDQGGKEDSFDLIIGGLKPPREGSFPPISGESLAWRRTTNRRGRQPKRLLGPQAHTVINRDLQDRPPSRSSDSEIITRLSGNRPYALPASHSMQSDSFEHINRRHEDDSAVQIYRVSWTCACGHQGFDDYKELCQDSVADLVETLRLNGLTVSMKSRLRMSTSRNILEVDLGCKKVSVNIDRLRITLRNLLLCSLSNLVNILRGRYFSVGSVGSDSHSKSMRFHWLPSIVDEPNLTTLASGTGTGGSPSAHTSANVSATANHSSQHQGIAPNAVSNKTPRTNKQPQAAFVHTSPAVINIPPANDFVLLCFRVQKHLTYRHDLGVANITRDMVLFKAIRNMYHSRFRWAHRHFSLRTVQNMKFVKFILRPRCEVDGLEVGMPSLVEAHYAYDPRPPGRIPALGSDFLMHRFNSPKACCHDDICLNQIPKRINEPPTLGIAPDLYTGWGLFLEEGLDPDRICILLLTGFVSSMTFGIVWGICKGSLQDGFAVAGFLASSEAVAVATVQLLLAIGTI